MSKSYNDPVKEKSRKALEQFVRMHLSFKRPKRIEVLCFPGAEQEGEAGLELKVYDTLGIPRKNITGLECDPERAERLKRANLGIEVVCAPDLEYLLDAAKQSRQWDVMSLDYCSFFTNDRWASLRTIAMNGLLKDTGILCTNYMGRRENEASKELLCDAFKASEVYKERTVDFKADDPEIMMKIWETLTSSLGQALSLRADPRCGSGKDSVGNVFGVVSL
ncbi:hypothetical protein J4219_01035, partial [Candidatus Woesearchaeota archaeon]|nr:hypothetical protein [Candidatus Woesearchaeota archaeon]